MLLPLHLCLEVALSGVPMKGASSWAWGKGPSSGSNVPTPHHLRWLILFFVKAPSFEARVAHRY